MYLVSTRIYAHHLPALIRDDIARLQRHRIDYAVEMLGFRRLAERAADAGRRGDLAASQTVLDEWRSARTGLGRYPHPLITLYATSPLRRPYRRYRLRADLVRH